MILEASGESPSLEESETLGPLETMDWLQQKGCRPIASADDWNNDISDSPDNQILIAVVPASGRDHYRDRRWSYIPSFCVIAGTNIQRRPKLEASAGIQVKHNRCRTTLYGIGEKSRLVLGGSSMDNSKTGVSDFFFVSNKTYLFRPPPGSTEESLARLLADSNEGSEGK